MPRARASSSPRARLLAPCRPDRLFSLLTKTNRWAGRGGVVRRAWAFAGDRRWRADQGRVLHLQQGGCHSIHGARERDGKCVGFDSRGRGCLATHQDSINYFTVDVEDYFQVAAFERVVSHEQWDGYASRVERNTGTVLDMLDAHGVKGTFFIVGWTAERYPAMVRDIVARGHDVACHSYRHRKVYDLSPDAFRQDTAKAKAILEDITGRRVYGYRAPTYSITKRSLWALDILQELGFTWDSSIFPVVHDQYGIPGAPRFRFKWPNHELVEYPLSTLSILGQNIPVSGGGYFRLFPYWFIRWALQRINMQEKQPFIFYLHPWEMDPDQPRINNAGWKSKFRHYRNLDKTAERLSNLLQDFRFKPIEALSG